MIAPGSNNWKEFALMDDPNQKEMVIKPVENNMAGSGVNLILLTMRREMIAEIRHRANTRNVS